MKKNVKKKAILLVLDSAGIGSLPDAALYGDQGANTLGRIAEAMPSLELPYLNGLGLHFLVPQFVQRKKAVLKNPCYVGRMAECSNGKDTITGHWELMGILTEEPSPTFPNGFPEPLLEQIAERTGVTFLGNEVASGTEIIQRLGTTHVQTGKPILYTSADSVLQIAAHEDILPVPQLYRLCATIREITSSGPYKVGRVIARPFIGQEGAYQRTANRHDFALPVPSPNLLESLLQQKKQVFSVGKIGDIFSGIYFTQAVHTSDNGDGMEQTSKLYQQLDEGLLFVNLVDFDMKYGHRRDIWGYGHALASFDEALGQLLTEIDDETIIIITADHGCDPGYQGTDHTREYVPLLIYGKGIRANQCIAERNSFADLAATLAQYFSVVYTAAGNSFAEEVFL